MTIKELEKEEINLNTDYQRLWDYLAGGDSLVLSNQKTQGLALPVGILNKVYYQNVVNFLKLE